MNQILITEKLYITPEIKRKKRIYKVELFLSVFLVCLLFSYYIYAEYDRTKTEQVSQEILTQLKYEVDPTVKKADNEVITVILSKETPDEEVSEPEPITSKVDTTVRTTKSGVKYTTDSILKIPTIGLEYAVLSDTSAELLNISLNKYWGPNPNEVGNYCIVGHYYDSYIETGKMFGRLHKLQNGDIAELTDLTGRTIKYQVYNKYVVKPTDTRCTSQLTNGKRELTLITCTNHGKERLVLKLREIQ